jgi:predicted nucleotidyltransferase
LRHGLRLESVLRDSLVDLKDRIELAFVFGSTARDRQGEDSDVDLMVIGDVSLKTLTGPLREAEKTLGRRIEPVIHTRESFRKKYVEGNPFLVEVYRREKISVIPAVQASTAGRLENELRAMVAEQLAST